MHVHVNAVAAGALPAGTVGGGGIAQPGTHHFERQAELTHARRPLQQPGVAALRQQGVALRGNPRGHAVVCFGVAHEFTSAVNHPRAATAAITCRATALRSTDESMRAKRLGSAAARSA